MIAVHHQGAFVYPQILTRIQPPKFAAREFEITRFGAQAGG
jgi:hypothetical protein